MGKVDFKNNIFIMNSANNRSNKVKTSNYNYYSSVDKKLLVVIC